MKKYDICLVNFCFRENPNITKYRPALVLNDNILINIAQITSHEPRVETDYRIIDWVGAGLNKASTIRFGQIMCGVNIEDLKKIGHLANIDIQNIEKLFTFEEDDQHHNAKKFEDKINELNKQLDETLNYQDQLAKMKAWHSGTRGANVVSMNNDKLKMNYDICKQYNWTNEINILWKEAVKRGLPWAASAQNNSQAVGTNNSVSNQIKSYQLTFQPSDFNYSAGKFLLDNLTRPSVFIHPSTNKAYGIRSQFIYLILSMALNKTMMIDIIKNNLIGVEGLNIAEIKSVITNCINDQEVMAEIENTKQKIENMQKN